MLYSVIYVILTATSMTLIHFIGNQLPDMLMILISSSTAFLVFNLINVKNIPHTYKQVWKYKNDLININILLAILWLATFFLAIYYNPSLMNLIVFFFAALISSFLQKGKMKVLLVIFSITLILVCTHILKDYHRVIYLMLGGVAYGASSTIFQMKSKDANNLGFSAIEILSTRFFVLILISLSYVIYDNQFATFQWSYLPKAILVGVISLVIPVYFNQKAVEKHKDVSVHIMMMALTPAVTAIMAYIFIPGTRFDVLFALSLLLFFIITSPYIIKYYKNRRKIIEK